MSFLNSVKQITTAHPESRSPKKSSSIVDKEIGFLPDWLKKRKDFQDEYLSCPSFDLIDKGSICEKLATNRNRFEKEALLDWVKKLPDLSWMSEKRMREICDKLNTVKYVQGEVLMKKGDEPDYVLFLLEGVLGVYIDEGNWLTEVKPPNIIGEAALKGHKERTATIIAHTNAKGLCLRSADYQTIVYKEKAQERRETTSFLASIPFFSGWKTIKIDRLSSKIMIKSFQAGQNVYHQNDTAINVFIVRSGHVDLEAFVEIETENRWPSGKRSWEVKMTKTIYKRTIRSCLSGTLFGEKEIVKNCQRSMRAVCREDTVLYIVEKDLLFDVFHERELKLLLELNEDEPEDENLRTLVSTDHLRKLKTKQSILDAFGVTPLPYGRPTLEELLQSKRYSMASDIIVRHRKSMSSQRVKSSHELIRVNKGVNWVLRLTRNYAEAPTNASQAQG